MRQLRTAIAAAVLTCLLSSVGHTAEQKPICAPLPVMQDYLTKAGYQLSMTAEGDDAVGMYFINAAGDWAELAVSKSGVACFVEVEPVAPVPLGTNPDKRSPYIDAEGGLHV